jgi:TRAP-type C4-dicarboxylate transport system permease small subunit
MREEHRRRARPVTGGLMSGLLDAINRNAERWALLVFYVMLVATMFIEVLRREVLSYSSIWGEEIVRYSFIYLAWIGCAAAVRERGHIRIDVIMQYVGRRVKTVLYIFGDLVMFGVALVALYYSYETAHVSYKFGNVTHGLRIGQVWFLAAVPVGFSLVIFRLIQSLIRDVKDLTAGRPVYEGDKLFD